jgi:lipopolysaccharide/colanic/teichoic acid biosynthesis glycosyltransferase
MVSVGAPTSLHANIVSDRRSLIAKRLLDIAIGVPLCVLVFPTVMVLALYLLVRFRANPFFVHQRIGHRGRLISIPKLRTLPPDTHPYADKTVVTLEAPHALTAFLRSRHLDELPQLFLVPIGRLSLVGPRPRMASEAEAHGDERYNAIRTSVRQGCTGLWQVSGDARDRVSDHPEYDVLYVSQATILLDVWVLWRTLLQALGSRPVDLEDVPSWLLRDAPASAYDFAI